MRQPAAFARRAADGSGAGGPGAGGFGAGGPGAGDAVLECAGGAAELSQPSPSHAPNSSNAGPPPSQS